MRLHMNVERRRETLLQVIEDAQITFDVEVTFHPFQIVVNAAINMNRINAALGQFFQHLITNAWGFYKCSSTWK